MELRSLLDSRFETTAGDRTLAEMLAPDRPTVFIAYPMDFTFVCTRQLCDYRDHWDALSSLPVRWWAVNQASLETHRRFKEQKNLPFELVTDPEGKLLKSLNLWGLLRTRRGFAVVSPAAEILETSSIFPFFYKSHDEVIRLIRPHVGEGGAG